MLIYVRDMMCAECKAAAAVLDEMMANGATLEELENLAITTCINFDMFPEDVCKGMVHLSSVSVESLYGRV